MLKLVKDLGFGAESIARTRADSTDDSLWQDESSPLHAAGRCLTDLITAKQVGGAGTIHIKLLDSSDGGLFGTAYLESNAASDITQVTIRITSSKYQLKIRAGPLDPRCCCLVSPGPPKVPSDCVWQSPPPPPPPDGKRPGPVWHEILVEPGDLNYTEGVLCLFVFTMGIPARFRVDVDLATPHKREGPSAVERRKQAAKEYRDITAVIRERDARIKLLNGGLRHSSKPSFPPQATPTPTLSLARSASPAWSPTNNSAADHVQEQQQQQQQPAQRRPASAPLGGRHPTDRLLVYRRDPSPQGMQRLGLRRTSRPGSAPGQDVVSSTAIATAAAAAAAAARRASSLLGQKRVSTWVGESGAVGRPPRPASAMEARREGTGEGTRPPRPASAMESRRDKIERPFGPGRLTSARNVEGRKAGGGWEGIEEDEGIFDDDGDDCDDFELGAITEEGGETREQSALLVDDEETDGLPEKLQRRVAASESQRPATMRAHGDLGQASISGQTRQRPQSARQVDVSSKGLLVDTVRHRPLSAMAERSREDDTESRARPFSAMARLAAHAAPEARPASARTDARGEFEAEYTDARGEFEAEFKVVRNKERRPKSAAAGRTVEKDASLNGVPPAWEKSVSAESIQSNAQASRGTAENASHGEGYLGGLDEEVEKIMRGDGIYMTARDMLVAVSEGRGVFDGDDSLSRRPSSAMGMRLPSTFRRRPSSVMMRRRSSAAASLEQKHHVVDETAGMGRLQGMLKQLELDHAAKTQLPQTDIYVKVVRASHLSILEGYRSADPLIQVKVCDTGGRGIVEVKKTPFKRQTTDPWFSTSIILNGRRLDEESYLEVSALHLSPVGTMRPTWGSLKIPIRDLSTGLLVAKWYTLTGGDHVAKGSTHEKPKVYLEMISGNEAERSAVLALNAHALMNPPVRRRREDKGKKASSSGNAAADNSRSSKGTGQARTVMKAAGGTGVSAARRMSQLLVAEPPPAPFPPPDMWAGIGVPGSLFAAFALNAAKEETESGDDIESVSLGGAGADVKELVALMVPDAFTLDLSHIPLASDDLLRYLKQIRTVSGGKGGLRNLILRGCTKLQAQDVGAFAAHFRDLRCIDVSSCAQVDDKFLAHVASSAPGLERASVAHCGRLTSAGIAALASGCPQMRSFDCQGCVRVDGQAVKLLASGFPMIKSLDLRGLRLVKGPDLAALRQCTRLRQLSIAGMRHPSESQLSLLCSGSGLERLDLGMCDGVGDVLAACLGKLKSLTDLSLHSARTLTDAGLAALASGHPPLTAIRIPRCNRISDLGLAKLASCCPSLQIVVLDNCPMVTDAGVSCLVDFCAQTLASLSLRGLKSITAPCILAAIRECFRLESLDLTGTECEGDARIEEARRARALPAQIGRNPALSAEVTLVVKRLSRELALSREAPCSLQIISGDPGVKGDVIGFRAARDLPRDIYMHMMQEGES